MASWRGKHHNLGLQDQRQLAATDRQHRILYSLYGRDHRGDGLTVATASDLISKGMKLKEEGRKGLSSIADQMFSKFMAKAIDAANAAGEEWLWKNPKPLFKVSTSDGPVSVHGFIGRAYITAPKKGSGLAKWLEEHGYDDRRSSKELVIHHQFIERLEGELQLVCCKAALEAFADAKSELGDIRIIFVCDEPDYQIAA